MLSLWEATIGSDTPYYREQLREVSGRAASLHKSVSDLLKNLRRKRQGLQSRIEQMEGLHSYKLDQRWLSDVQSLVAENKRLQKELDESRALVETHKAEAEIVAEQRDKLQLKLENIKQLLDPSDAAPEPTMRDLWQEHLDTLK